MKLSTLTKTSIFHPFTNNSNSMPPQNTNFRLASGVLSNIDHQTKNLNIDQISTTQHFIDQISTAKFT